MSLTVLERLLGPVTTVKSDTMEAMPGPLLVTVAPTRAESRNEEAGQEREVVPKFELFDLGHAHPLEVEISL